MNRSIAMLKHIASMLLNQPFISSKDGLVLKILESAYQYLILMNDSIVGKIRNRRKKLSLWGFELN